MTQMELAYKSGISDKKISRIRTCSYWREQRRIIAQNHTYERYLVGPASVASDGGDLRAVHLSVRRDI
jgi:hypothetical protein